MISATVDREIVDLIGRIYDCVLDTGRWYDTLDRIRLHFRFHNAMLGINNLASDTMVLQVAANVSPDMIEVARVHGAHMLELWGGWERVASVPLEEPAIQSEATNPRTWPDNPFFRAFGVPQGIVENVGIALARDPNTLASIGFGRHRSAPALTSREIDGLRILAPHLRRAVIISRILHVASTSAQNFEAALDASRAGVVLVDAAMQLIHANAAATAMLEAGDPIRLQGNRVELVNDLAPGQIELAVQEAASNEGGIGQHGVGIPARRLSGAALTLNVMPLERRQPHSPRRAVAAIFIGDQSTGAQPARDLLSIMLDITPAEAGVFELTVAGHPTAEIAQRLGISVHTVRTHLNRIFAKTGRRSRMELMQLAKEISLPR